MNTSIGQSSQSSSLGISQASGTAPKYTTAPNYSQTLNAQGYSPIGSPATTTTLSAAAQVAQQSQGLITTSKPQDEEKANVTPPSPTAPAPITSLQLNSSSTQTNKALQAYQQSSSDR